MGGEVRTESRRELLSPVTDVDSMVTADDGELVWMASPSPSWRLNISDFEIYPKNQTCSSSFTFIFQSNILIDQNFPGKVADFGLTKLTEAGTTRLVGTFGYMPPEYAQYGEVSAKVDVYAFGVVLYELISGKEAVVKDPTSITESKGLVGMFEVVHNHPDPNEICKLIDPSMEDNYPLDAVLKMAQVAKACTNENPQLRPTMRYVAVALMTLSSSTEDWNASTFYDNHNLVNLMSGR